MSATPVNKYPNRNAVSLYSQLLAQCCCSVEFNRMFSDVFVVGNYELVDNNRIGGISVFRTDGETFKLIEFVETDAVLDLKWCNNFLASAESKGNISIYNYSNDGSPYLHRVSTIESDTIALSIDWNASSERTRIVGSFGSGHVKLFQFHSSEIVELNSWKSHEYEAWITAFGSSTSIISDDIVFSGGDDSLLIGYDIRSGTKCFISKEHTAGVTSLNLHPSKYLLASGSYDEDVCIWDLRNLKNPLIKLGTGGGVWRLKWHSKEDWLLAACMHNGMHVLSLHESVNGYQLFNDCDFMNHDSMAYGSDWSNFSDKKNLIVSCSFYDKSVHLWEWNNI